MSAFIYISISKWKDRTTRTYCIAIYLYAQCTLHIHGQAVCSRSSFFEFLSISSWSHTPLTLSFSPFSSVDLLCIHLYCSGSMSSPPPPSVPLQPRRLLQHFPDFKSTRAKRTDSILRLNFKRFCLKRIGYRQTRVRRGRGRWGE